MIRHILMGVLATLITSIIPAILAYRKTAKDYAAAKAATETATTEAEKAKAETAKEKAKADLLAMAKGFIAAAEVAFDGFDKMLKAQGKPGAGAMKKDSVFNKLQAYALQHGYEFDADEWGKKIDELVSYTKRVNAKQNPGA